MNEQPELSVIAPCFNEELNLAEFARRVLGVFTKGGLHGELVLVDDGSRDNTKAVIEGLVAAHSGRVVGCYHPHNRGIAQGWRSGLDVSSGRLVAVMDSDLQYQPEDLLRLKRALEEHAVDIVQGWRSPIGRERGSRYNVSRIFNLMLNAGFGMRLRDNKSGFVMCSREVLDDLLTYRGSYFYWQSFIMVSAHAKGYAYHEVETLFENRRAGTSFLAGNTTRVAVRSVGDFVKAVWEYRIKSSSDQLPEHILRRHPVEDRSSNPPARVQSARR